MYIFISLVYKCTHEHTHMQVYKYLHIYTDNKYFLCKFTIY